MKKISRSKKVVFIITFLIILLCGCNSSDNSSKSGLDFIIKNNTATYIDYFYKVEISIADYSNYSFTFENDDPTPKEGQEYAPSRSLIINSSQDNESGAIEVVGILGSNGYYDDFEGQETILEHGKYKINKDNDTVSFMYIIDSQSPFLKVNMSRQLFDSLETKIMDMAKSLKQHTPQAPN